MYFRLILVVSLKEGIGEVQITKTYCSILCTLVLLLLIKYSFHIYKHVQFFVSSYRCITMSFFILYISFLHSLLLDIIQQLYSLFIFVFLKDQVQCCASCLNPMEGDLKHPQDPYLHAISQFMQNTEFFSSQPNALFPLLNNNFHVITQ